MQVPSFDYLLDRVCFELPILDTMYFTFDEII